MTVEKISRSTVHSRRSTDKRSGSLWTMVCGPWTRAFKGRRRDRGQSAIEYSMYVVVCVLAMLAMQLYVKFAVAGRAKASTDNLSATLFNPDGDKVAFRNCRETTDKALAGGASTSRLDEQDLYLTTLSAGGALPALPNCPWE